MKSRLFLCWGVLLNISCGSPAQPSDIVIGKWLGYTQVISCESNSFDGRSCAGRPTAELSIEIVKADPMSGQIMSDRLGYSFPVSGGQTSQHIQLTSTVTMPPLMPRSTLKLSLTGEVRLVRPGGARMEGFFETKETFAGGRTQTGEIGTLVMVRNHKFWVCHSRPCLPVPVLTGVGE